MFITMHKKESDAYTIDSLIREYAKQNGMEYREDVMLGAEIKMGAYWFATYSWKIQNGKGNDTVTVNLVCSGVS